MSRHPPKTTHVTYPSVGVVRRESTRRLSTADPVISHALERIRKDACAGLSAREVLAETGLNRRVAEIRFRRLTGHSVLDEIRSVRLEAAKKLLANKLISVEAIAHQCGYDTLPAFSCFFKAETGLSPRDWRQRTSAIPPTTK